MLHQLRTSHFQTSDGVLTGLLQVTTDYLLAENYGGAEQEHLLCLNRGVSDTGSDWFEANISAVAAAVTEAQSCDNGEVSFPLQVSLWWGMQDEVVPRPGQCQ